MKIQRDHEKIVALGDIKFGACFETPEGDVMLCTRNNGTMGEVDCVDVVDGTLKTYSTKKSVRKLDTTLVINLKGSN